MKKTLFSEYDDLDLIFLNDGSPTRISPPGGSISIVDVSLISSEIASKYTWDNSPHYESSDHFPTICKIGVGPSTIVTFM